MPMAMLGMNGDVGYPYICDTNSKSTHSHTKAALKNSLRAIDFFN